MHAGDRVGLHGLQATELNGLMGTVTAPMNGHCLHACVGLGVDDCLRRVAGAARVHAI